MAKNANSTPTPFDFGELAANAVASSPDAALFAMLGRARAIRDVLDVARRRGERAYHKALQAHCREACALGDKIGQTPARSREAMVQKALYALEGSRAPGTIEDTFTGLHGAVFSALHDFLRAEDWV